MIGASLGSLGTTSATPALRGFKLDPICQRCRFILVGSIRVADCEIDPQTSVNVMRTTPSFINVIVGTTAFLTPIVFAKPIREQPDYLDTLLRHRDEDPVFEDDSDGKEPANAFGPVGCELLG